LKRGWDVVATVRGSRKTGLHEVAEHSVGQLRIERVDIADFSQIIELRKRIANCQFNLLFVNAGIANGPEETISAVTTEEFVRVMVTNALGPMRVVETLGDLVRPDGTIGVMSSRLGSVAANETGGWEIYRGSKAALNTLMRSYAARHRGDFRTFLLVAPGWVRTEIGGPEATLSVEDSIPRVVDTIGATSGKRGLHYLDYQGESIPW
jgi:NAD(P)-dependent dehydrogenase (short-subunit alcohol dehydrogenase family)